MMQFIDLRKTLRADFYRYDGAANLSARLRVYLLEPGMRFTFWLRVSAYLRSHGCLRPLYVVSWLIHHHYAVTYGIDVPVKASIGPGLHIAHCGGIVISGQAVIGRNCNVSHGVTIGVANRGKRKGHPTIGDEVYLGPGAKVFGNIVVGSQVAIGANAVVTHDIPDRAVAAGVPAKVISTAGSDGYIAWTEWD